MKEKLVSSIPESLPNIVPFDLWEESFRRKGEVWVEVAGRSMEPIIGQGERVLVKEAEPNDISIGEIITFALKGNLVTHRVIGKIRHRNGTIFWEKGDGNILPGRISDEHVLGKVIAVKCDSGAREFSNGKAKCLDNSLLLATLCKAVFPVYEICFRLKNMLIGNRSTGLGEFFLRAWARMFSKLQRPSEID